MKEVLIDFSLKYDGEFDGIFGALQNKEAVDYEQFDELKQNLDCQCVTILDDEYPDSLKEIIYPPFVLFARGDISLLKGISFSLFGTNKPTDYGIEMTKTVSSYLADQDVALVTGLYNEIDITAAKEYLEKGKKVIAVLPAGIDYTNIATRDVYAEIVKKGLVISEYPPGVKPRKDRLAKRNRLVTGLSRKMIITETRRKGQAMIATGFALEQGKDVICVPTRFGENDGCNYLISLGAKALLDLDDLMIDRDLAHPLFEVDQHRKKNQNIDL